MSLKTCVICGNEFNAREGALTCSVKCRVAHHREAAKKPYDASSIRVLKPDEIASRFEWVHIADLAKKYARPEEWIERGFRACEHAGVSPDYFVERYLEKTGVDFREDVDAAFRELYLRKFDPGACLSL